MERLRVCARASLLALLVLAAGCNLTDTEPPNSASYRLQSDKPVQLVTSTVFTVGGTDVTLYEADTVTVSAKEETVALDTQPRFFVRAIALEPGTNVQLIVDVGDRRWFDTNRTINLGEKLEFVYGYTGTTF